MRSVFVVDRQNRTFISLHDTRAAPIQLTIAYIYSNNRISNLTESRIMMLRDFSRTRCKSAALSLEFKSSLTSLNRLLGPAQYTLRVGRDGLVTCPWCGCRVLRWACLCVCLFASISRSELSVGLFCVTLSNPTHQLTDPTQPDPILYKWKKFGPHPIQLTMELAV